MPKCDELALNAINPDYNTLFQYAVDLSQDSKVDSKIQLFVLDLVRSTDLNMDSIKELYNGAFVIVRDRGYLYRKYKENGRDCNIKGLVPETSHDSLAKMRQYRMGKGSLYKAAFHVLDKAKANDMFDLLVGTSPLVQFYGDTWLQFEKAGIKTLKECAHHVAAFVQYVCIGKNVGPFGSSDYAEYKKPLILTTCRPHESHEPVKCVRGRIKHDALTEEFLKRNNMSQYKEIRTFVKAALDDTRKIVIEEVVDSLELYDDGRYETGRNGVLANLQTCLEHVTFLFDSKEPYDREEIIEILFLVWYMISPLLRKNQQLQDSKRLLEQNARILEIMKKRYQQT